MTPVPATQSVPNKTTIACNRCKSAHIKCGGSPGKICPGCIKANKRCVYPKTGKKKVVLEEDVDDLVAQIKSLEAQIKFLEAQLQELQANQSVHDNESVVLINEKIPRNLNSMYEESESVFVSPSGEPTYMGPGAGTSFLVRLGKRTQDLSMEFQHQDEGDHATWRRPPNANPIQLPRPAVAKHLFESQYAYIGTIFAFAQRKHFEARLEHFSRFLPDPSSQESCLAYCQLLLIYAYGELYSVNQWISDGPPGLHFFKHALKYLPSAHEPGSVLHVEVLGMVGYYFQVLNWRDAAFLYIGMALRMAIFLGLHQEMGDKVTISAMDREHRRRVWWSIYSMDRIISVKWGNPITIHDGDIGVKWPSSLPELDDDSPCAIVLSCYSKLSRILGKIGEDIYRKKHLSGNTLVLAIQSIMNDLSAWWRNLPDSLRINPATIHLQLSREAVSTYLHFHHCVNMTVRPLLYSVTQERLKAKSRPTDQDWRQDLPAVVVSNIESSIAAALSAAQIMTSALNKNLLATYGFMDGEHAFSSALTLVMANIALDNNAVNVTGMETALRVLQSMAGKGNRYVEYRLGLLQNLRSTIPDKQGTLAQGATNASQPSRPFSPTQQNHSPRIQEHPHAPNQQSQSFDGTTNPAPYAIPPIPNLGDGIFADFVIATDVQEHDMAFDMNMEDDAHLGFLDDQEWIQDTQHLSEQIYE